MKLLVKKGKTSRLIDVFIQDTSVTTGAGLSGLVFNTASLTAYYHREGDAAMTAITLATGTVGTWGTGMFKEIDATNAKGVYQLGIPNACLATGANQCVIYVKGATNMAPLVLEIQLTDLDLEDATGTGLTSLASATNLATANAALVTIAGYLDTEIAAIKAVTDVLPNGGALTSLATASNLAAAKVVVDAIKVVTDALPNSGALSSLATASNLTAAKAVVDAIKVVTDALPNAGALTSIATASNLASAKVVVDAIKVTTDLNLDAKISAIMTTAMTEGYSADGAAPTPTQMMFMLWSALMERNTSGVTVTTKKLDGSTDAMTFTLNDATNPSSITRAT